MKISELRNHHYRCVHCPYPNRMEHEPESKIYKYLRPFATWDMFRKHMREYHNDEFMELIKELKD